MNQNRYQAVAVIQKISTRKIGYGILDTSTGAVVYEGYPRKDDARCHADQMNARVAA